MVSSSNNNQPIASFFNKETNSSNPSLQLNQTNPKNIIHQKKKSSWVWQYFIQIDDKYKCNVITNEIPCEHRGFALSTSTSNLSDHLCEVHKIGKDSGNIQQAGGQNTIFICHYPYFLKPKKRN